MTGAIKFWIIVGIALMLSAGAAYITKQAYNYGYQTAELEGKKREADAIAKHMEFEREQAQIIRDQEARHLKETLGLRQKFAASLKAAEEKDLADATTIPTVIIDGTCSCPPAVSKRVSNHLNSIHRGSEPSPSP